MTKHYVLGVPDAVNKKWEPQETCGFDLADVSSRTKLNNMPDDVMGVVYLGMTSLNQQFKDRIDEWKTNPKVYAYYIVDEPVPVQIGNHTPIVPIATIKAMSDYIHQTHPGAKTFVKCTNEAGTDKPKWSYTPENTGLDLIGVGGYAVRSRFPGNYDAGLIERYVEAAVRDGIPLDKMVPCYQCFGGVADWPLPTKEQMDGMFASWRRAIPNPPMDYAYRWFIQPQWGTEGLGNNQMMRDAIKRHFKAMAEGPSSGGTKFRIIVDGATVADVELKTASTLSFVRTG